jgi:hypothetical protein
MGFGEGGRSMQSILYLHLGLSKTATTWLQRQVFPHLPGIAFRNQPGSALLDGGPMQGALARAFRRSPLVWQRMGGRLLRDLVGPGHPGQGGVLVSDQSAGPRLFEYGRYSGPHWERERMDPGMLRDHLAALAEVARNEGFAAVRAILVVRRQDHWLASKYAQRSDRIVGASQRDFEDRVAYYLDERRGFFADGVILDYAALMEHVGAALGPEGALGLPYELLRSDPGTFVARIADFLDVDPAAEAGHLGPIVRSAAGKPVNVRSDRQDEWVLRRPGRPMTVESVTSTALHILRYSSVRRKIMLTEALSARILGRYAESNRAFGRRMGLDLSSAGYFPAEEERVPEPASVRF